MNTNRATSICLFRVGELLCGFTSDVAREIIHVPEIRLIPGAPPYILGLINLRSQILTAFHLAVCLGLPQATITPASRHLILSLPSGRLSCQVDQVESILRLNENAWIPTPNLPANLLPFVSRAAVREYGLAALLDPDQIYHSLCPTSHLPTTQKS